MCHDGHVHEAFLEDRRNFREHLIPGDVVGDHVHLSVVRVSNLGAVIHQQLIDSMRNGIVSNKVKCSHRFSVIVLLLL